MEELLVLVDENDNELNYCEKMDTHINEKLHRAFSLFIYNKSDREILLHKRALGKYHSGGLWTNSCCSHPRKGELIVDAVVRRTQEELGVDIGCYKDTIVELGKFQYYKRYENCAEHEIDHVFVLVVDAYFNTHINTEEIEDVKWISIKDIDSWIESEPDNFTAWFSPAYKMVARYIYNLQ